MYKMKIYLALLSFCLPLLFTGCNSKEATKEEQQIQQQYNISILLDLSDRISPEKYPDQYARDTAAIKVVTECFIKNMKELGVFNSKGKIKVFAYPNPKDPNINNIMKNLDVDCSTMDSKKKKDIYDNLSQTFQEGIKFIYDCSITTKGWHGSDVWRFFKDDVERYCIDKDSNYRNILIVLTDGYIYEKTTKLNQGNRYTYIENSNVKPYRGNIQKMKNDDFGLMSTRNDLKNLEVLVLEVNPKYDPNDYDILQYCLAKWFTEMGVCDFDICKTDFPNNTEKAIESFLNQ